MNALFSGGLLTLSVLWPLLLAFMLTFKIARPLALYLSPLAGLPALMASLLVTPGEMRWHFPEILLGSEIGLDATGQVFMLLTALLWTVSGIYARIYFSDPAQRTRFYIFFLLAMTGNFALIVAHDLFGFYLGFALMSFASYGLVVFTGSEAALRAGRIYMVLVVVGELMLFVAFLIAVQRTGATTFDTIRPGLALIDSDTRALVILLSVVGFGIKAGFLGLHVWLPLAHPVAPTPASAVLSGAMIKAGLLGWLRLLPIGEITLPEWGVVFLLFGLVAAFYGVAIGLTQRESKTLLAYSSISQMGIMIMAIGLGMLSPHAWSVILPTIAFYALHHGLSKGALFLGVGLTGSCHHLQRRWVWLGLSLPALALAGAPWTSGMFAKLLLKTNALYAPSPWDFLLPLLLTASAVATALLMVRLLYLTRPAAQPSNLAPVAGLVWPWVTALLAVLLVPWWQISAMLGQENDSVRIIIDSLWPIIAAFFIALMVWRLGLFQTVRSLPAGDILVLIEHNLRLIYHIRNFLISFRNVLSNIQMWYKTSLIELIIVIKKILKDAENKFAHWNVAIVFAVMIALGMGLSFSFLE